MTSFDKAFEYTMEWEGGEKYTNDPLDPGGETKWGLSKRAHPDIEIKDLTEEKAKTIYALCYWSAINGNEVAKISERVAIKYFDMAVNMGATRATKIVQDALNGIEGVAERLWVDGRPGNATLRALRQADEDDLLAEIVPLLEEFYRKIDNERFIKGWLRRARALPV